ncbi:DUF1131 family protein [Maricaulis sp. CAU 1757]
MLCPDRPLRLLAVLLAPALASCSDLTTSQDDATGTPGPAWQASGEALGPIQADTPFDRATLAQLLPEYTVSLGVMEIEGMRTPVIEAREINGFATLAFFDDGAGEEIGSVRIRSRGVVANAARLGDTLAEADLPLDNCFAGLEAISGQIVCPDPEEPSLIYWVNGDFDGLPTDMPDAETLGTGEIHEIVWIPERD